MSLRFQLLLFGLLTLVLPWTGLRYVREMEGALRGGLEQSLQGRATTVAAALEEQHLPLCSAPPCTVDDTARGTTIYAAPLAVEPSLDGVRDDWNSGDAAVEIGDGDRVYAGVYGRFVYLFVTVADRDLVYQRLPGQRPYGDRVALALEPTPGVVRWLLLNTSAPGAFRAQETSPDRFEPTEAYDARVIGAWQETATGYALEVRVPLNLVGAALGVGVIDVDRSGADYTAALAATWDETSRAPGRFIYQRPELKVLLDQFGRGAGRFRILDADGWVLSAAGSVEPRATERGTTTLVGDLFRWLLRRDDPPYLGELPPGRVADPALRVALARQRRDGVVRQRTGPRGDRRGRRADHGRGRAARRRAARASQRSDPDADERCARAPDDGHAARDRDRGLGLLGYATWLSLRVRRLAQAAETALGPRGEIRTRMPGPPRATSSACSRAASRSCSSGCASTPIPAHAVGQALARAAHAARGRHDFARQSRARGQGRHGRAVPETAA